MFGIKMKPEKILKMVQGFGIDTNALIAGLEGLLLQEAIKMEAEAGEPLKAVVSLSDDKTHLIVSMYKGTTDLTLWKSFALSNITQLLNNLQNADSTTTDTPKPIAAIAASSTEPTEPATTDSTEPAASAGAPDNDGSGSTGNI